MNTTGIPSQPHNGETKVTMAFLAQTCPTQVELLLDYIQLVHQNPDQSLPALLVYGANSVERRTTIFGQWLAQTLKTAPRPPKTMDNLEVKYFVGIEETEEIARKIPGIAVPVQLSNQLILLGIPQWHQWNRKSPMAIIPLPTLPGGEPQADILPQLITEIPALLQFLQNRSLLHANVGEYYFATAITLP